MGSSAQRDFSKDQETDRQFDLRGIPWHILDEQTVIQNLKAKSNLTSEGLTSQDALERLKVYGLNELSGKRKETIWEKIWKQLANVLVGILLIVAVVSAARAITEATFANPDKDTILTSWIEVGLIVFVVAINTYVGVQQEGSAEAAAEALKNMLSSDARVIRDGKQQLIPAKDVVPGDVIILSLGDRVPADIRLMRISNLACQEAALTGESVPIDKTIEVLKLHDNSNPENIPLGDRKNMCYSATLVAQGSGVGIAIATGDSTQIGNINKLVSEVKQKKTAVLAQVDYVSKVIAIAVTTATLITFFVARWVAHLGWFEAVSIALVCAVAMIPEGLQAIVTLVYAWAVMRMAQNNAIIRVLPAVETLGSVTVICSDKTGTLTQNLMSLTSFVTSNARYRFDVNNQERTSTNLIRDDSYLSRRADHQQSKRLNSIIADGPLSGELRTNQFNRSFHFTVDSTVDTPTAPEASLFEPSSTPVADGESPPLKWIRSVISGGILCSHCVLGFNGGREGEIGNPTEISLLRAAYFCGIDIDKLKDDSKLIAEVPFSSEYKFMATVHEPVLELDGDIPTDYYVVHVKGAPDRLTRLCRSQAKAGNVSEIEPLNEEFWIEEIAVLSSHGLRVIALCRAVIPKASVHPGAQLGPEFVHSREEDRWLTMVGLAAIMDPPRPECIQAINEAHHAGVRVTMITGDHKDTAKAIGRMLGIIDSAYPDAITGSELDALDDDEMQKAVMTYNVFARSSPLNKIRIVEALQAQGQITSMTGDGVNDAPALKAADIGIAMGKEGTDVAREASQMILSDDNFATIVTAVREGRAVWDNLRKILLVNTPINNAQGLSVLFGMVLGLEETPLSAIQVLCSNLICAVTLGFVLAIEPAEKGIMDIPPRRVGKRLIGRYLLLRIAVGTTILTFAVVTSAFWLIYLNNGTKIDPRIKDCVGSACPKYDYYDIHSICYNTLNLGAISITLSARFSYNPSYSKMILTGNKYCWYAIAIVVVLQILSTYVPLVNSKIFEMKPMDGVQWGIVIVFIVVVFIVMEFEKYILRRVKSKKAQHQVDTFIEEVDSKAK